MKLLWVSIGLCAMLAWVSVAFAPFGLSMKLVLGALVLAILLIAMAVVTLIRIRQKTDATPALPRDHDAPVVDNERSGAIDRVFARATHALRAGTPRSFWLGRTTQLPICLVIGPERSGKTSLLRNSGLAFPVEGAVHGRAANGTGTCDWWVTGEAVLVDTAGRYASCGAESDRVEWNRLLALLASHRRSRPVDALVVTVSAEEIQTRSEDDLTELARTIRRRLDDVTSRFQRVVPVYVVFTKMDLVAGFSELWADVQKATRGQAWGMAFAKGDAFDPGVAFADELAALTRHVNLRAMRRLHSEPRLSARRALLDFPVEFECLAPRFTALIATAFERRDEREAPLLRGAYFTSALQGAQPTALFTRNLSAGIGLEGVPLTPGRNESGAFFITDLLRRVLPRDVGAAEPTAYALQRQTLGRVGFASVAVLLSLGLVAPGLASYGRNLGLQRSAVALSSALASDHWGPAQFNETAVSHLDAAGGFLAQLEGWNASSPPLGVRWGFYSGRELGAGLREAFSAVVVRSVVAPAKRALEEELREIETTPVRSSERFARETDALKLYRMLGEPTHIDVAWGASRLVRVWTETAHERMRGEQDRLTPHIAALMDLIQRGEVAPLELEPGLVARSKAILSQVPQQERLYEALVRDSNADLLPIGRESVFQGDSARFVVGRKGVKVTGAYTKAGWTTVRTLLGQQRMKLAKEEWVFGEPAQTSDAVVRQLRDLYFARYQEAWRAFIADIEVQDPGNAEIAVDELQALSEPEWPYLRLIRLVADNVTLESDDSVLPTIVTSTLQTVNAVGDAGLLLPKRTPTPVEEAFRQFVAFGAPTAGATEPTGSMSTALGQYEALLARLAGALGDVRDSDVGTDPRKVSDVFQEAFRSTGALLSAQDAFTRPLLAPLLQSPITLAWSSVVHDAGSAIGANWESSVWQDYHSKLEGRYPFADSATDADLNDVLDFFQPGSGSLWSFYEDSLRATLERSGTVFTPSRRFRSTLGYTGEFLSACLKRGAEITASLFPPKRDKASAGFEVRLYSVSPSISEVTLEVDGAAHVYRNGPETWIPVAWPGTATHGARLKVRGAGGYEEEIVRGGDWGLMRLLDEARVGPPRLERANEDGSAFVARWPLHTGPGNTFVALELRPSRRESPLRPGYFREFACPRTISSK